MSFFVFIGKAIVAVTGVAIGLVFGWISILYAAFSTEYFISLEAYYGSFPAYTGLWVYGIITALSVPYVLLRLPHGFSPFVVFLTIFGRYRDDGSVRSAEEAAHVDPPDIDIDLSQFNGDMGETVRSAFKDPSDFARQKAETERMTREARKKKARVEEYIRAQEEHAKAAEEHARWAAREEELRKRFRDDE